MPRALDLSLRPSAGSLVVLTPSQIAQRQCSVAPQLPVTRISTLVTKIPWARHQFESEQGAAFAVIFHDVYYWITFIDTFDK